ncbi:Site-specific DNA recombinase [Modestobacter sp. DSM 44400]|uniref:recombinase family protein n=1 Tax=Modestobacter sp. DSM 44400 TaxID=1550230 RepID=UPI000896CCDD|nr:recombinase family protein [Modestobacter sp. DSM 44400]SDX78281.1 Site-specific DNA recombinase [Modestobacter sp. DSM 44400]
MTATLNGPTVRPGASLADVPRAAVYCRISDDRRGLGLGVERQRQDCHELARRHGWEVVSTYTDNDVSAYSGKPRPQYAQLMEFVQAGKVDVVLAWDPDRLHRSPAELESFIVAVERAGVDVVTVQAGEWDLSTANGRLTARLLGSIARHESEHKSERVRRALEQNATAGRSHGRRAYGWQRQQTPEGVLREVIVPSEAAVVRRIAEALLAGESLRSLTAALNAEGVPSATGKPWGKNMVRALVLRERNAGLRVHRGEVVGEGAWEAILDRGRWEQLRAVLSDPGRRTSTGTAAAHLLSGIARCGVCGATLRVAQNRGVPSYRCSASGCVIRRKGDLDGLVVGVVTARLARPDALGLFTPDDSVERSAALAEAEQLRGRLDHAADQYADGAIDGRQLERITAKLRPLLAAAEGRARVLDPAPLLDGLVGAEDVVEVWESLPLSRRRAVVDTLLTITVSQTRQGARTFDPEAVAIGWKGPGA